MKIRKIYIYFLSLVLAWGAASCDYGDLNVDPNQPANAPLGSLLSASEVTFAFTVGADVSQITGVFMQQFSGVVDQALQWDRYNVPAAQTNTLFNTLYAGVLKDLDVLTKRAEAAQEPRYSGMAKILTANVLGVATDLYGDLPYSQAFQGVANRFPGYDRQEEIYATIQGLLDAGITDLQQAGTGPALAADFIYQGDGKKWIAAAYTLKARYHLHLTKRDGEAAARAVLDDLYNGGTYRGISGNANDFELVFVGGATSSNPWFLVMSQRPDFRLGKFLVDLMHTPATDPRLPFYAQEVASGGYKGGAPGAGDATASRIGTYYGSANSPVPLISYVEAKFIEAEARLRLNENDPQAEVAMQEAIRASFAKIGKGTIPQTAISTYLASQGLLTGTREDKLKTLITQKYIALFTQPEVWTDWRRTGYPEIKLHTFGVNGLNPNGQIPRRLPLAQGEKLNNPNAPQDPESMQEPRLYWDR